ncbi:MAG TPA: uracil-DNA glycosylase [Gallionella sp.]
MDRREAILRELNLYPQWKRRNQPAPQPEKMAGDPLPAETESTPQHATEQSVIVAEAEAVVAIAVDASAPLHPSQVAGYPAGGRAGRLGGGAADTQQSANVDKLDWPELKQRVSDCTACKLRAGCTQTVFGVGDEKADWLFVGEGPGADEDALGEPFVGQAGKLLDNMLLAIKLKRGENVYITNIVKCRPPGNRNPEAEEIATCLPYLRRQIELIKPKMIVALGKVASNALLGKDATLASLRGKPHDYRGIPLIVTYHPAYLLRSPSEKAKAWQDLCMAVDTMLKA